MNLMKNLWMLIAISLLSSCTSIPDFEACGNLTRGRGFCTKVLSKEERIIEANEWYQIRTKSVLIPAKDYGKVKGYIIKQCNRNDSCKKKHMPGITGTFQKLDKAVR